MLADGDEPGRRLKPLLLAAALLLSACGAGVPASPTVPPVPTPSPTVPPVPTPTDGPTPGDPAKLDGRTFLSVSVTQAGVERALVPNARIRLDFRNGGQLSVAAGCNTMGATYRIENGKLLTSGGATTEIGCEQAAQAQDEWVFAFVLSSPVVDLDGNDLTLTQGDLVGKFLDREVAEPDLALSGRTWTVTTILAGDIASSVPAGVVATLRFGEDGGVAVSTGCNTGGGTYAVDGKKIAFGPIGLTKMACAGAAGEMERAVLAVLGADGLTSAIEASTLTLTSGGDGLVLTAD